MYCQDRCCFRHANRWRARIVPHRSDYETLTHDSRSAVGQADAGRHDSGWLLLMHDTHWVDLGCLVASFERTPTEYTRTMPRLHKALRCVTVFSLCAPRKDRSVKSALCQLPVASSLCDISTTTIT